MTLVSIIGWVLAVVTALFLGKSAVDKLRGTQEAVGNMKYINLEDYRELIGTLELVSAIALLIPSLSLYGMIVIISLMSGAAAVHLCMFKGEKTWLPVLIGVGAVLAHVLRLTF